MARYKLTDKASKDLKEILEYTQTTWGAEKALSYLDGFDDLAKMLSKAPHLGVKRDNIAPGLSVFPYEKHLLFYKKAAHGVTVVRVLHKSMDVYLHFD